MQRLDGGLATALQQAGLPPYTPVEPWLREHPGRIAAAHHDFVQAGSDIVLTATFLAAAQPETLSQVVPLAVSLAAPSGGEVWGCSGPVAPHPSAYAELARALVEEGVTRLVLETFTDADDALHAVSAVRAISGLTDIVLSLTPLDGRPLAVQLATTAKRAAELGATGIGLNCIAADTAARHLPALQHAGLPLWLKLGPSRSWPEDVAPLAPHCTWLGGCCGIGPAHLAALWEIL